MTNATQAPTLYETHRAEADRAIKESKSLGAAVYRYPAPGSHASGLRACLYTSCTSVTLAGESESLYTGEGWTVLVYAPP